MVDYASMFMLLSVAVSAVVLAIVVICETLTLYRLGYKSFWRSLVISLVVNLVSTALGYGVTFIQYQIPYHYIPFLLIDARTTVFEVLMLFGVFWAVSIVSEGGVFILLDKTRPSKVIWRMMFIANTVSYVVLILIYFFFIGRHTL